MNIPQLQIQTTNGVLNLQIIKPIQEIEQPKATMSQQQPAAILEMSTTRPRLSLDTNELRADIDLKSIRRRIEENAQFGKQSVMEGIARRAREGQQLIQIESGSNAIAEISKHNGTPPPAPIGIRFIGDRLKIQMAFQLGTLDIQIHRQNPINDVTINPPIHRYTVGKVTGEMDPYPSIQIDVKW